MPCAATCVAPNICEGVGAAGSCAPAVLHAAYTADIVTIDGALRESAYDAATPVTFRRADGGSDNVVTVRAIWTDTALIIAYEVVDAKLEIGSFVHSGDGTEIFLDPLLDRSATMQPDDKHMIFRIDGAIGFSQGFDAAFAVAFPAGGFSFETELPFADIGFTPISGGEMGLLLGQNDRDNGVSVQYDWVDLISSGGYSRPNLWGTLRLEGP